MISWFLAQTTSDGWSSEWVILLTFITGSIGAAVAWMAGRGLESLIKWRQFRLDERERLAKQRMQEAKPFSAAQMWEDKTLAMGYKALLFRQDETIRDLQGQVGTLTTLHQKCVEDHAQSNAKLETCERDLQDQRHKSDRLERKLDELMKERRGSQNDTQMKERRGSQNDTQI
jgi:hypothetical protein